MKKYFNVKVIGIINVIVLLLFTMIGASILFDDKKDMFLLLILVAVTLICTIIIIVLLFNSTNTPTAFYADINTVNTIRLAYKYARNYNIRHSAITKSGSIVTTLECVQAQLRKDNVIIRFDLVEDDHVDILFVDII